MSYEYIRLRLEIAPGVHPVTGRLSDPGGPWTAFAGWAQLVRVIERAAGLQIDRTEGDDATPEGPTQQWRSS